MSRHENSTMSKRPFHIGCEFTGLGICYCQEGTPSHLRSEEAAEAYCRKAERIRELWEAIATVHETPEETQILLPVIYKRKAKSKHKIEVEGLKAAKEEADNARASAERLTLKAVRKASALGITCDLPLDLNLNGTLEGVAIAEETVDQKSEALQSQQEQIRQEIRKLDRQKDEMGLNMEKETNAIGDGVEATLRQLRTIKGKLPPDRLDEIAAIEEAAHAIVAKSRKSRRKQRRLLKSDDIGEGLVGTWLSVFWPDDNQWWNVFVQSVNVSRATATLLYETEEAEEVNLRQLIEKGEVAWLDILTTTSDTNNKRRKKHHVVCP